MDRKLICLLSGVALLGACSGAPKKAETRQGAAAPIVDLRNAGSVPQAAAPSTSSATGGGAYLAGDGPGADVPTNLDAIPDAVPKAEPLHKYANRQYSALGKTYTPLQATGDYKERGIASWYGKKFHGQNTSIGEVYDMYAMTAAHPTLPIPSYARVTNPANKKSVVVRINDRGPFLHERVMDLSYTAAHKLGYIGIGSAEVEVESLAPDTVIAPIAAAGRVTSTPLPPASVPPQAAAPAQDAVSGSNVYLQLGAFKTQEAAESFMAQMRAKLSDLGKQLSLFVKDGLTRVHLGPYADQNEARSNADSLQGKLGFKPLVNLR